MKGMRRKDRSVTQKAAKSILNIGEYGVLSTVSDKGEPYGVPLSYCVIENSIYFHSAVDGEKIEHIEKNNKVSFCVVGETNVLPSKFSTEYESVIIFGEVDEVHDVAKQKALEELVHKYSPEFAEKGLAYIKESSIETRVFKISIKHLSGKTRK